MSFIGNRYCFRVDQVIGSPYSAVFTMLLQTFTIATIGRIGELDRISIAGNTGNATTNDIAGRLVKKPDSFENGDRIGGVDE
jgi:hypothetical protein